MEKIGIITQYYKSRNYGGVLQSYALCKYINNHNISCEQICYQIEHFARNEKQTEIKKQLKKFVKKLIDFPIQKKLRMREKNFDKFIDEIPHSEVVYNDATIARAVEQYDCFIAGSDQIWNMNWFHEPYFLSFVPEEKGKYSYAASMGSSKINSSDEAFLSTALKEFNGISVREADTAVLLSDLLQKDVTHVLDPTLLLTKEEWNQVASKRLIDKKYVFCYFLGSDDQIRKLAKEYAKKKGYQLVSIPFLQNHVQGCDVKFGACGITEASPGDMISLIKNAECIFTDSFHASVFSCIYKKQFFVFERKGHKMMSNRIDSLCNLFQFETHYCNQEEKRTLTYLLNVENLKHDRQENFDEALRISKEYLDKILQCYQ